MKLKLTTPISKNTVAQMRLVGHSTIEDAVLDTAVYSLTEIKVCARELSAQIKVLITRRRTRAIALYIVPALLSVHVACSSK